MGIFFAAVKKMLVGVSIISIALRVAHPKVGIPVAGVGCPWDRSDHVGLRRNVEGL